MTEPAARKPFSSTQPRNVHLIGIAGNGMRAMADVLLGWGWSVSGSDLNCSAVNYLTDQVKLFEGHSAENVPPDAELAVHSDAVPPDNPELLHAVERGIPTLSYFEMLGRLGAERNLTAIAGTHGKSTVTAMAAHLMIRSGLDPTVVCGAASLGATSGGRAGRSDFMLVEACEYRRNFLNLKPNKAAILGIEPDHFDCFRSLDELEAAFERFAVSLPNDGLLIARHDCPVTRRAAAQARCRIETFGFSPDADWLAKNVAQPPSAVPHHQKQPRAAVLHNCFEIRRFGRRFCEARLHIPGRHNVLNALAAAALAHNNGVSADQIAAGLSDFPGLHRRMELLGERRGVAIIDDYAHHPTEVRAALAAAREMFPDRRLWCVFQPHQASRTAQLLDELAESLQNADKVLVAEIFRAREGDARPGDVSADDLARKATEAGAEVLPDRSDREITETLETHLAPGDVLITLGAGETSNLRPFQDDSIDM